jgi:membrane-associated protease RseP (regulator of RpoE activity)
LAYPTEGPDLPAAYSYAEPLRPPLPPARRKFQGRTGLHLLLFFLTLATTTLVGADHYAAFQSEFGREQVAFSWGLLWNGLWYSLTILGILGAHEMGHYLYCRKYGVDATLPYFIPLPPIIFLTGTLGAVIRIRSPFPTKAILFDIGIAGPIGGMLVLVPALFYGLTLSPLVPEPTGEGMLLFLGEPLLFQWATAWVAGPIPEGYTINMHPMVFACWFGLLATALNLLPFGQLDGGHIAYAAFGRHSWMVSAMTLVVVVGLAVQSVSWIVFAVLLLIMWRFVGLGHPPPLNDHERIGRGRLALAVFAALIFVVCFTPRPIEISDLVPVTRGTTAAASNNP